MTSAMSQCWFT